MDDLPVTKRARREPGSTELSMQQLSLNSKHDKRSKFAEHVMDVGINSFVFQPEHQKLQREQGIKALSTITPNFLATLQLCIKKENEEDRPTMAQAILAIDSVSPDEETFSTYDFMFDLNAVSEFVKYIEQTLIPNAQGVSVYKLPLALRRIKECIPPTDEEQNTCIMMR